MTVPAGIVPIVKAKIRKKAEQLKKTALKQLDSEYIEQKQKLEKELPKKVVKKGTRYTIVALVCLIGGILLIVIALLFGKTLFHAGEQTKLQKTEEKLEQYFVNGDYEAMSRYLNRLEEYNASFKKYEETAQIYKDYTDWVLRMSDDWQDYLLDERSGKNPEDGRYLLEYLLEYSNEIFVCCDDWRHDTMIRGNEDVLEEFSGKTEELLRDTYKLSDSQIKRLTEEELEEAEITELAEAILKQYAE